MIAVLVVAAGLAFVIWRIEATIDAHAPEQEPELSWLDHADGVTCNRGHFYQLNPARDTWVCATCHHQVPREVSA